MTYSDNPASTPYGNSQVNRPGAPPPQRAAGGQPYGSSRVGRPGAPPPQGRGTAAGGPRTQRGPNPALASSTPAPQGRALVPTESDDEDEFNSRNSYEDEPDEGDNNQPPRRQYKYSSATMQQGNCRKYACIVLMFLLFLGFSIGLSMLISHFFFNEDDTAGATQAEPFEQANATFQRDKAYVDTACGAHTYDQDGGLKCKEACEPQYSECCRSFLPENIFANATTNATTATASEDPNLSPDRTTDETCSMASETSGCISYSKCIAAVGIDPAPAALPIYCSEPRLTEDKETCVDICSLHRCCYAQDDRRHCRADKLDVCLDYASCQNLREGPKLETAPADLDKQCFHHTPECDAICKRAECCNIDHANSCFQTDFVSCLTYAPCNYSPFTTANITVAPQFSVLPKLPESIVPACNERHQSTYSTSQSPEKCEDVCKAAECCYDENPATNCFKHDPLGCLAWDQQCQENKFTQ